MRVVSPPVTPATTSEVVDAIFRLYRLAEEKQWPANDPLGRPILENIGKLFQELSSDELRLISTLLENFELCKQQDYLPRMQATLAKFEAKDLAGTNSILIVPLVSPKDAATRQIKSGHAFLYGVWHSLLPQVETFSGIKAVAYQTIYDVPEASFVPGAAVLFLDDFIGSGTTAKRAMKDYFARIHKDGVRVLVASLYAQQAGIKEMLKFSATFKYGRFVPKGISDNPDFEQPLAALALMDGIEARLSFEKYYRRGYKESEALITLLRAPNNTFPAFWCQQKKYRRGVWPAPFER